MEPRDSAPTADRHPVAQARLESDRVATQRTIHCWPAVDRQRARPMFRELYGSGRRRRCRRHARTEKRRWKYEARASHSETSLPTMATHEYLSGEEVIGELHRERLQRSRGNADLAATSVQKPAVSPRSSWRRTPTMTLSPGRARQVHSRRSGSCDWLPLSPPKDSPGGAAASKRSNSAAATRSGPQLGEAADTAAGRGDRSGRDCKPGGRR